MIDWLIDWLFDSIQSPEATGKQQSVVVKTDDYNNKLKWLIFNLENEDKNAFYETTSDANLLYWPFSHKNCQDDDMKRCVVNLSHVSSWHHCVKASVGAKYRRSNLQVRALRFSYSLIEATQGPSEIRHTLRTLRHTLRFPRRKISHICTALDRELPVKFHPRLLVVTKSAIYPAQLQSNNCTCRLHLRKRLRQEKANRKTASVKRESDWKPIKFNSKALQEKKIIGTQNTSQTMGALFLLPLPPQFLCLPFWLASSPLHPRKLHKWRRNSHRTLYVPLYTAVHVLIPAVHVACKEKTSSVFV